MFVLIDIYSVQLFAFYFQQWLRRLTRCFLITCLTESRITVADMKADLQETVPIKKTNYLACMEKMLLPKEDFIKYFCKIFLLILKEKSGFDWLKKLRKVKGPSRSLIHQDLEPLNFSRECPDPTRAHF